MRVLAVLGVSSVWSGMWTVVWLSGGSELVVWRLRSAEAVLWNMGTDMGEFKMHTKQNNIYIYIYIVYTARALIQHIITNQSLINPIISSSDVC